MSNKREGIKRVQVKLESAIEEGNYYEAHQMYRTLYFRYMNNNRFAELADMLFQGAVLFLSRGQQMSGADLSNLYVDTLIKLGNHPSDSEMKNVAQLHSLISPNTAERAAFTSNAIKWSNEGSQMHGHPKFHEMLAVTLWKEKNYSESRFHFLHSCDGEGCAMMLMEYHINKGFPSEVDLFIAQAVLQYLCLKNKSTALVAFTTFTAKHPNIGEGPPFILPLLNFLWFLLLAIDSGKLTIFTVLCEQYQPSLSRDPGYNDYLDKIGQIFFGVPPPKSKSNDFFDNLLQSLVSRYNSDENEASQSEPSNSQRSYQSLIKSDDVD